MSGIEQQSTHTQANRLNELILEQRGSTVLQDSLIKNKIIPPLFFSPRYMPHSGSNTQRTITKSNSALEVIKVSSTYEYYYYLKHKQEYQKKQLELIAPLKTDGQASEHISRITYSIKQVGVSNTNDGKFGIQSQRKFIQSSEQKVNIKDLPLTFQQPQNDRINYKFNSKRLNIGISPRQDKKDIIALYPNKLLQVDDPSKGNKTIHYHNVKMIKRINQNITLQDRKVSGGLDTKFDEVPSYSRLISQLSKRGLKDSQFYEVNSNKFQTDRNNINSKLSNGSNLSGGSKKPQILQNYIKPMPQIYNKLESYYTS